jgi:uncharacterized protein (DUF111 family)
MKIDRIAYGAGDRDFPGAPNVLRLLLGELTDSYAEDRSTIIETNIDDMNPQLYGHIMEKLLSQGAQDVYLTPIIMKKGRPAMLLSVLTEDARTEAMLDVIFRETTSIGVRIVASGRKKLRREIRHVDTPYGRIRIKISKRNDEIMTVTPEYEDCKKIADQRQVPVKTVMEEARINFTTRTAAGEP